jgi:hypothetical protein
MPLHSRWQVGRIHHSPNHKHHPSFPWSWEKNLQVSSWLCLKRILKYRILHHNLNFLMDRATFTFSFQCSLVTSRKNELTCSWYSRNKDDEGLCIWSFLLQKLNIHKVKFKLLFLQLLAALTIDWSGGRAWIQLLNKLVFGMRLATNF